MQRFFEITFGLIGVGVLIVGGFVAHGDPSILAVGIACLAYAKASGIKADLE